ncbi:hypothetical protein TWF730_004392 [Orbilia blumenaviensis]|uniref:F-box domain-containing protein n=1 Tax=Orbilia blumenaviensis TaxID=1796055 RepID=A0AAV9TXR8_9PEZI
MSVTALPPELLLQIFGELDIADIYNLKRSCKRFNDISQHSRHSCVFKIDAPGHPTWKLIRYLLRNPDVGKQVVDIRVEWHRRGSTENDHIGREQWTWTKREMEAIELIIRGTDPSITLRLETAIFGGINSEALFPLLLIFTPSLESLDLGVVNEQLITYPHGNYVNRDVLNAFLRLFDDDYRTRYSFPESFAEWRERSGATSTQSSRNLYLRERINFDIACRAQFKVYARDHVPSGDQPYYREPGLTWLAHTIAWESPRMTGLFNIKHFKCTTENRSRHTDAALYRIFTCDNIETILIDRCFRTQGLVQSRRKWDHSFDGAFSDLIKKNTGLRKVELLKGHFCDEDLELLAKMTVNLEYLAIERVIEFDTSIPIYISNYQDPPELSLNRIGNSFLEHNKKLRLEDIIITDYTGKGWGNGSFGGLRGY